MVALFDAENKKDEKEEDEIDMAFTACSVRMRIHLNKDQIEDVIQEVEGVVRRAINNVWKGYANIDPISHSLHAAWCKRHTKSNVQLSFHAAATATAATTTATAATYWEPGSDWTGKWRLLPSIR